jgi:hypothetical protein
MDQSKSIDESNIDNLITNNKIIQDIEKTLLDLKLQHNALVRTTSRTYNISDKIPGYSLLDAAWKKLYYSKLVNNKDDYKLKLFDIPIPSVANGGAKRTRKSRKH